MKLKEKSKTAFVNLLAIQIFLLSHRLQKNIGKNCCLKQKAHWLRRVRQEYETAIESQAEVCSKIFNRPISVICGAARDR